MQKRIWLTLVSGEKITSAGFRKLLLALVGHDRFGRGGGLLVRKVSDGGFRFLFFFIPPPTAAGIAHGPVIAGVIGASKPQYDIWGTTVNMASRMESTGVSGRIQVPESTSSILVELGFLRQLRGNIHIKGISERHGKVCTFFVSSREERWSVLERGGRGLLLNRNTLGAVVYSLVQARKRERLREENGGFHLVEAS